MTNLPLTHALSLSLKSSNLDDCAFMHRQLDNLGRLQIASPFAYQNYHQLDECASFIDEFSLDVFFDKTTIDNLVQSHTQNLTDDIQVKRALRVLRKKVMVRWIYQDTLGLTTVPQLTQELSDFADSVICFSQAFIYNKLADKYGEPYCQKGASKSKPPPKDELMIVAMGKLGAGELNLSSDIDLIFVHCQNGETDGKKSIDNQKFMTHLGRGIIALIDEMTADGFVFRVDMRLRPWGDGSPLVITLPALAKYFDQHGRTWERFAWLKGRVVNRVSEPVLAQIAKLKKEFVFRYYVDYSTFSALREMRMLIANQVFQREDLDNIKLGVGGIRDIEFIAQSYALIYGGQFVYLTQKTKCLDALDMLCALKILDNKTTDELKNAYVFLRRLEHAIQARHDTQTQKLPATDELNQIAITLGFDSGAMLIDTLNFHRQNVSLPFDKLVANRQTLSDNTPIHHTDNLHKLTDILSENNQKQLNAFWQSKLIINLSDEEKKRLARAYPVIIQSLINLDNATINSVLPRVIVLLEAIVKRSIYLIMLSENPKATMDLVPMLAISPWVANELATYPVLLDTFLQKRYTHLPDKAELSAILAQSLLSVADFDDEAFLQAIRLFKKTQVLAVACSDVLNHQPIMKVSDSLTFIAQTVLTACLNRAFDELVAKHGTPIHKNNSTIDKANCGFGIIGYGKLGGIEMSYASDLDVVFLHDIDEKADTTGNTPISGMKFATRLVQKIINYLTAPTRDGRAYELDMRLRPSGNAGVMVVSVNAFEHYQSDKAWAWEHQALVRARAICGDKAVLDEFEKIRHNILAKYRDVSQVKNDVGVMRQKMSEHLSLKNANQFHLKHDKGGLVDIEFMAQFMVLSYAWRYPDLALWSDNVRIFEALAKTDCLPKQTCEQLTQSYLALRAKTHTLALKANRAIMTDDEPDWAYLNQIRQFVACQWALMIGK